MNSTAPKVRLDLEFFPVQQEGREYILIKDHLGLVEQGRAVTLPLYRIMSLLDGTKTPSELQVELIRHQGGKFLAMEEVERILGHLDECYLLDSERYWKARDQIIADFASQKLRPCSHSGRAYPEEPLELKSRLDEILGSAPPPPEPAGTVKAQVTPHIDLSVGKKTYARAYNLLPYTAPSRVVLLGVGHQMINQMFSLTDKDFQTPLGTVKSDSDLIQELRKSGGNAVAPDDFIHRSEHSIEFQLLFLQHLLQKESFKILPILCGNLQGCLEQYSRKAFLDKAESFLYKLRQVAEDPDTLVIAGVDFSHIGPKFGHDKSAVYLEDQAKVHDQNLLRHLCRLDADSFWEESAKVQDRFNVCGFSALACFLEILPFCKGQVLDYEVWHEQATSSAVGFSAVVFVS